MTYKVVSLSLTVGLAALLASCAPRVLNLSLSRYLNEESETIDLLKRVDECPSLLEREWWSGELKAELVARDGNTFYSMNLKYNATEPRIPLGHLELNVSTSDNEHYTIVAEPDDSLVYIRRGFFWRLVDIDELGPLGMLYLRGIHVLKQKVSKVCPSSK